MMIQALRRVITRMHCPPDVMLTCVRWYTAWPLSLRHIKEMMDVAPELIPSSLIQG